MSVALLDVGPEDLRHVARREVYFFGSELRVESKLSEAGAGIQDIINNFPHGLLLDLCILFFVVQDFVGQAKVQELPKYFKLSALFPILLGPCLNNRLFFLHAIISY